ncbi:MAG: hypothetical protein ACOC97_00815 [Myxococcota bacterium]
MGARIHGALGVAAAVAVGLAGCGGGADPDATARVEVGPLALSESDPLADVELEAVLAPEVFAGGEGESVEVRLCATARVAEGSSSANIGVQVEAAPPYEAGRKTRTGQGSARACIGAVVGHCEAGVPCVVAGGAGAWRLSGTVTAVDLTLEAELFGAAVDEAGGEPLLTLEAFE